MSRPSALDGRPASITAVLAAAVLFGTTGTSQALGPKDATPLAIGTVRLVLGLFGTVVGRFRRGPAR